MEVENFKIEKKNNLPPLDMWESFLSIKRVGKNKSQETVQHIFETRTFLFYDTWQGKLNSKKLSKNICLHNDKKDSVAVGRDTPGLIHHCVPRSLNKGAKGKLALYRYV